jgi:ABC-type sulfate transport system substrate-binding protein
MKNVWLNYLISIQIIGMLFLTVSLGLLLSANVFAERTLLNVSDDPTRELYKEFNQLFVKHWKEKTGEDVAIGVGA